jgi:hypothetical protein
MPIQYTESVSVIDETTVQTIAEYLSNGYVWVYLENVDEECVRILRQVFYTRIIVRNRMRPNSYIMQPSKFSESIAFLFCVDDL